MATSAIENQYNTALGQNLTKKSEMDKETFLKLLVTQFQYQDPLNPMEDKEFVSQLAQFNSLEQLMTLNDSMNTLTAVQLQNQTLSAANYIGKEVAAKGYGISKKDGKISNIQYAIDENMVKGYANILDANKQTICTISLGAKGPGVYDFKDWEGLTQDGSEAPDGVYTVYFSGTNEDGDTMIVDTQVSGRVSAVSTYNGEQYLKLSDGRVVALKEVREIVEPTVIKPEEKPDDKPADKPTDPADPDAPVDPDDPKPEQPLPKPEPEDPDAPTDEEDTTTP